MLCNPAGLKAGAVVQPVVGPQVKGCKVDVAGVVVCQEVLALIEGPPGPQWRCYNLFLSIKKIGNKPYVVVAACQEDVCDSAL